MTRTLRPLEERASRHCSSEAKPAFSSVRGAASLALFGAAMLLLAASPARAHHGDADRYNQEVITVTGTVVEVQMVNPHAHIVFDVVEGGKTVRWQAELGGPQQLIKQFNWTPATIKPGMKLTMIGRRLKSGAPYMNLTERANIVVADTGKEIFRTPNFGEPAPTGPKGTLN